MCSLIHLPDALGQQYDTASIFKLPITLDTFVVKSNFDINIFIKKIRNDTTFYKAFKSMKMVAYDAGNDYKVLDKSGEIKASMRCRSKQTITKGCRQTQFHDQVVTGDFYKRNGDYNYYTTNLFAYLFFAPKPECGLNDMVAGSMENRGEGKMEKSKYELKQLIFNPGSKVAGVPLMGDKASIFDESEMNKYTFKVSVENYNDTECFVFRILPKKEYEQKVVYNELTTWFRKGDYSIMARNYSLSYHTLIYDFDVTMKVRLKLIGGKLYPVSIFYDGNWHVFTKKRERVQVKMDIAY